MTQLDAASILQTARQEGDLPQGWTVIPLNVKAVQRAILSWLGGAAVGIGLFVLLLVAINGSGLGFGSAIILGLLAFVGLGSLWLAIKNVALLNDRERQLIVMTPELYVQQRGAKIVSVPMGEIAHITLRGVFGGDASYTTINESDPNNAVLGFGSLFGGVRPRRPRRTPDSLAFVDARTDEPITIAEDNSFADLPVLEEILRNYVDTANRARKI
jgi:hypothetical protein